MHKNTLNAIDEIVFNSIANNRHCYVSPSYDVYLAAGFFNDRQNEALQQIIDVCDELGLKTYEPRRDSVQIGKNPTEEERQLNFDMNLDAILKSKFIIASTEGKDMGTIFEVGFAYANHIPVFGFAPFIPEGMPFNLMLAQSMEEVFLSKDAMLDYFKNGVKPSRVEAC